MRKAKKIVLSEKEKSDLELICRSPSSEYRYVLRAKIILYASERKINKRISKLLGLSENTVAYWRNRFHKYRLEGLKDNPGRGRKKVYDEEKEKEIVQMTIAKVPKNATHWSTRKLGEKLKISHMTVWRIWNKNELKPHILRTFKLSKDKHFEEKLHDVVGLYLNPPEHSIVLCVDEKSQIQALDRTQPGLPMKKGKNGTWTHDYVRHGTCTLFAALNYLDGSIIAECTKKHRHQEYLNFLKTINKKTPNNMDLHLIVDNYSTHKHEKVKNWLSKHSRFHIHYIPTSSSWLNLVERFFAKITNERIRRGIFKSVIQLIEAIHSYIGEHNKNPKPFVWTKTVQQILEKLAPIYNQT